MQIEIIITVSSVIVVLVLIRLLLPTLALFYVNRFLRKHATIHGTVSKIRMSLLTGKFRISGIRIALTDDQAHIDNLTIAILEATIDVRLWSLLRKKVFASISLQQPEVTYANVLAKPEAPGNKKEESHADAQPAIPSSLKKVLEKILPFKIDLNVNQGLIRYINHTAKPHHTLALENLALSVRNLSNQPESGTEPASIAATASLFGGILSLDLKLKPLEEYLTFDSNLKLEEAQMISLNDYFRAYANIDVNAGTLSVYTEIVAIDGGFKGYIKPVLKDIDIIGSEDKGDSLFKKIWERMVAVAVQGLENNKLDQLATKIKIEGRLDDPHLNVFAALSGVFRNAFIQAVQPSLENALGLGSVIKSAVSGTTNFVKKFFE